MPDHPVGISDIALYVPSPYITLQTLLNMRIRENPSLERRLNRAVETTGQEAMRFPELWQDNTTLAAEAAHRLVERSYRDDLASLRYIAVGTETGVDHSKPVAAYVEGMLQRAGVGIPDSLSTFQVQHACAGGTVSILGVAAMLSMSSRETDSGLVICSDIARYDVPSTAEITQGAGAVALKVAQNPSLMSVDVGTAGYCSRDVDDFFRPLGSTTAKVKGGYSVQCYHEALDSAFADHCARRNEDPLDVLNSTDVFVTHIPFYRMGITAMHNLLGKHLPGGEADAEPFLLARGFYDGIAPARQIGNIYSGSAYMALAFSLQERYRKLGPDIVGKKVLVASYGSGNTMIVYSATIAENAPAVIESWDLDEVLAGGIPASLETYQAWVGGPYSRDTYAGMMADVDVPQSRHYLASVREDGYREYEYS
ncbi:MAG: hydroxymethylglutaryl-CoA synthase [Spirochaetaceae bacterium]|nr:MAG: hydroxymethylglutaryl-CoA synthase [Spirochaetaceae bacterium]